MGEKGDENQEYLVLLKSQIEKAIKGDKPAMSWLIFFLSASEINDLWRNSRVRKITLAQWYFSSADTIAVS